MRRGRNQFSVFRSVWSRGCRETGKQGEWERTPKALGSSSSFPYRSWLSPMGLQGVGGHPWIKTHRASAASVLPDQGLNLDFQRDLPRPSSTQGTESSHVGTAAERWALLPSHQLSVGHGLSTPQWLY